ncbi:MAG: type II toxin-antitoxin system PemK/MazF family toxin [Anaerolineales bacterium]|nr:type II toxin-antitoxin system PemK/MazF family toxin [Anaerolineales bacterium]
MLIPFPFDDLSSAKVRPALCLTQSIGPYQHVVLAFITSQIVSSPLPTDLPIDVNDPEFGGTGLRVASTIQLHRLMTASTSLIRRELGSLSPRLQLQVEQRLRLLFGLQ